MCPASMFFIPFDWALISVLAVIFIIVAGPTLREIFDKRLRSLLRGVARRE